MGIGGSWVARFDDEPGNGDVLVTTARGRPLALIYATAGNRDEAMERAKAFIVAAAPSWCSACGVKTTATDTCSTCAQWWAANQPAA
jgi:hypothetical protein